MANWSELPHDLLELITSYLSLTDVNRFSAVCQTWRLIAKKKRFAPVPQLPWVVLTEDPETRKRKLFNMSEQRHYYIDLPELRGGNCVGSSFGWLFIVSPKIEGYLVNPFTGVRYLLPPLPLYSEDLEIDKFVNGKFEYEIDGRLITWNLKVLQKLNISKAVLSDDPNKCEDFVTMIFVLGVCKMAFCRPKDNVWTIVPDSVGINEFICYKGSIYAVGGCNSFYKVDLDPEPKLRQIKPWVIESITVESKYLVDYFGKHLLLLHRNKVSNNDIFLKQDKDNDDECGQYHFVSNFFAVFELDLEKEEWHKWSDLGGNALFLVLTGLLPYAPQNFQVARLIASISLLITPTLLSVINTDLMMLACIILLKIAWRNFMKTISQTHPCLLGWFPTLNY